MILVAIVSVPSYGLYSAFTRQSSNQNISFRAALIDSLSLTDPNSTFVDSTRNLLLTSGYSVDYYGPDQVTVDFYRTLPSKNYGLVIIRSHSTGWVSGHPITIITGEPWSEKYLYEQLTDRVAAAKLYNNKTYFDITSNFVSENMQGMFSNSIIIMMGCTGLKNSEMARAFVARGAGVYISWDKSVTASRTDTATTTLVQSLVAGRTIAEGIKDSMKVVGLDLIFQSQLGYNPQTHGGMMLAVPTTKASMSTG